MARPKITLVMSDGAEVRTLEELREHADIYTLEQYYFDGSLLRWLKAWGHPWEQIMGDIERYDGDYTLHETLCDAFQIPWSEALEDNYQRMVEAAQKTMKFEEQDLVEEEKIEEKLMEMNIESKETEKPVDQMTIEELQEVVNNPENYDMVTRHTAYKLLLVKTFSAAFGKARAEHQKQDLEKDDKGDMSHNE